MKKIWISSRFRFEEINSGEMFKLSSKEFPLLVKSIMETRVEPHRSGVMIFHSAEFNIFYRDKVKASPSHPFSVSFNLSTQATVSYRRFSERLPLSNAV